MRSLSTSLSDGFLASQYALFLFMVWTSSLEPFKKLFIAQHIKPLHQPRLSQENWASMTFGNKAIHVGIRIYTNIGTVGGMKIYKTIIRWSWKHSLVWILMNWSRKGSGSLLCLTSWLWKERPLHFYLPKPMHLLTGKLPKNLQRRRFILTRAWWWYYQD